MTGASREHHGERHAGSLAASAGDLVALPRRPAVGSDVYLVGGEEAVHGGGESGSNAAVCTSLGRFRLALLPQPKTLQQCGHGVAETAILQLGIGQHRGPRPALAAHLDSFALGALADLVPRRVVEEVGMGLRKAAFFVD